MKPTSFRSGRLTRTSDNTEKILEKSERDREDFQDTTKGILNAILKLAEKSVK